MPVIDIHAREVIAFLIDPHLAEFADTSLVALASG
jgi:hypothetical protein